MDTIPTTSLPLPDLSFRELALFVELGQRGSVRETARSVRMQPANVSRVIRRIEERIGAKLLRSGPKGVQLTEEGSNVLKQARKILEQASLLREPSTQVGEITRQLNLGCVNDLAVHLVPAVLKRMEGSSNPMTLRLLESSSEDLLRLGMEGALDLALHFGDSEWTRSWLSQSVGSVAWAMYANRDHELSRLTEGVHQSDLGRFSIAVPTVKLHRSTGLTQEPCPLPRFSRRPGIEVSTSSSAIQIALHSNQLAFVPRIVAAPLVRAGVVKELRVAEWTRPIEQEVFLSAKADTVPNAFFRGLVQACTQLLASSELS